MKAVLLILFEISILLNSTTIFSQQSYSVEIPALETFIGVHSYYQMDIGFNRLKAGDDGWIYRSYLTWNNILQYIPTNSQILYVEFIIYWQHYYDVTNVKYVDFDNSGSYYSRWEKIGQGTVLASFPSTTSNYSFSWLINRVQDIVNGSGSNELHIGIKNQIEFSPNYPQYFVHWYTANVVMNVTFIPPNQLVTLDQRKSNNQQVGVLRKWEGTQFTDPPFLPGSQFPFAISQPQTIIGDQTIQDNEKYNNWNFDKSDVRNHHTFTITSETSELTSRFELTYSGITIKNSLEGTTTDGGVVEFRDPWFIDYPDPAFENQLRNRGMNDALFYSRTSPFYPDYTTSYNGLTYKGVFLNQGWPNWQPPYYSVKANLTQDITLYNTGNLSGRSHKFYFRNWSYDANKISLKTPGSNETAVVFKTPDAELSANLKGTNLSDDQKAYNTTSQRKFIKTPDGYLHSVYSSLGRVWYEQSPDNGASWFIISQQPLDDGEAKLPSIDYGYYDNPEGNDFYWTVIVYQEKFGSGFKIKAKSFQRTQIGEYYLYQDVKELVTYSSVSYSTDANPVLAIDVSGLITFVWEQKSGDAGLYRSNSQVNSNGLQTPGTPSKLTGTNSSSANPSVTVTKSWFSGTTRHIVWQAPGVVNSTDIIYKTFEYSGSQSGTTNISNGNGYPVNYSPCISLANGKPVVSWTGYFDGNMHKITGEQDEIMRVRALVKVKGATGWGSFTELGDNVNYVNNNSVTSASEKTVFVWSQGTTPQSKWIRRDGSSSSKQFSNIGNLSHSGIENQLTSGSDFNNMYAMVFNRQSVPFYFIKSTTNFSQDPIGGGIEKMGTLEQISYGRSGIISKSGVEFVFNTGDVFVADSSLQFTFIPDTLVLTSAEELNTAARTENFWLEEGVDFYFSNLYYVIRQELADSVLTEQDQVNFKVELVRAQSGNVVGTFDNITYNKNNLEKYASIHYLVNTSGIQAGEYYLRLVTTVAGNAGYNLSNIQRDEFDLSKLNYVNVSFTGEGLPVSYELSQNYPNPFNPSTTIRYQLPKDGMVTLKVYDILGAEVVTLVNEEKVAGKYEVNFDASTLASGVYIYRLNVNDPSAGSEQGYVSVKKMVLLK